MEGFFDRLALLAGDEAVRLYSSWHAVVIGVGGVGGWCAEALARSAVGRITLIDCDLVAPSNVNRQLPATTKTVGRAKVEVLAERLAEINPSAEITPVFARYTEESSASFKLDEADWVVDAIDSVADKAHLINSVTRMGKPRLVSSMGASGRFDPLAIKATDFSKVTGDGLAKALRTRFKKSGVYPAKKFTAVWSSEPRRKAGGTIMPVTASFGLALAAEILTSPFRKA